MTIMGLLSLIWLLFFRVDLGSRTQADSGRVYYKIEASSQASLRSIMGYLDKYPLFGSKSLDYLGWREVALYVLEGTQFDHVDRVEKIRESMNSTRTDFNWDHLSILDSY